MTVINKTALPRSKLSPAKQALLKKRIRGEVAPVSPPKAIPPGVEETSPSLSFGQQRLWFLHQLNPANPAYHIFAAFRLEGLLDISLLEQSLRQVIQRHQVLRTGFVTAEGRPAAVVAPQPAVKIEVVDLHAVPPAERASRILELAHQHHQQPFDLAAPPLLRLTALRLSYKSHILLVIMHHIISDEWSMGLFMDELAATYAALSKNQSPDLAELPLQYADFARWQRERLQGEILASLDYWRQQLAGSPPALALPTDRPRPSVQQSQGKTQSLDLPRQLTEQLNALGRLEDATLFMILLAAFQTLLYHYAGQNDILVGSPIANRTRAEFEQVIGFFVNTLVFRASFDGNPTFRELLRRVRTTALEAYTHQDLPFEVLVEKLQPERNLSHHPLFQVMFVYQHAPLEESNIADLNIAPYEIPLETAKFDLTLFVKNTSRGLTCQLEYNTDLFDDDRIGRMLGHFQVLLQGIVAASGETRVAELPLLTTAERDQLLVQWNNTQAGYPALCVHELFEAQAARTPQAVAVVFGEQHLTYQHLNEQANRLARHLRLAGVGPDVLVGLCLERSIEMVVGVWAILKAGGAYVPLKPDDPPERLAFMIADARLSIVLTRQKWVDHLPPESARFIVMDEADFSGESGENLRNQTSLDHLAYLIYTSGSAGQPKGVMIPHRGVVNYLSWAKQAYPVTQGSGSPVNSPLAFDLTVTSLFTPLLAGRAAYLLPEGIEADILSDALQSDVDFSLIKLTPAHLELLKPQLSAQETGPNTQAFIIGGENLSADVLAPWRDSAGDTLLVNEYGPTETVVGCCVYRIPPRQHRSGSIPIGRPIANTQIYIVDQHMQPVPIGVPGEICIGGDGLARGYLNQPHLTRRKFVANPFRPGGSRLYKTGDLGRYLPDGNIEFLGRLDNQVKLRGFRIELGEIESALQQHPAVQEAVVIVREDAPGDRRLVAYIVSHPKNRPAAEALDHFLKQKLPTYMIPAAVVFLDALPLTTNGKVDRQALPAPDLTLSARGSFFVAPRDALENQLAQIWQDILRVQPIGINDNFFDLGGHSLLAVRLFAQIEAVLGYTLPVAALFQSPTIAQLAGALRRQETRTGTSLVPIQPDGENPPFFCVHGMGGGVLDYVDLARYVGTDRPFYGLQERGLDGQSEPFATIEEMAAHYITEIQNVQSAGPYFLGGYCYGGTVAFEIVRQLHRQGQPIALLAVIDNTAPGVNNYEAIWKPRIAAKFLKNLPFWLYDFLQLSPAAMAARIRRKLRIVKKDLEHQFDPQLAEQLSPADIEAVIDLDLSEIPQKYHKFLWAHYDALQRYTPQPYPGKITLFRTRRYSALGPFDPQMGWSELAGQGVELKEIKGFHANLLQPPYVQQLAAQLREALEQ